MSKPIVTYSKKKQYKQVSVPDNSASKSKAWDLIVASCKTPESIKSFHMNSNSAKEEKENHRDFADLSKVSKRPVVDLSVIEIDKIVDGVKGIEIGANAFTPIKLNLLTPKKLNNFTPKNTGYVTPNTQQPCTPNPTKSLLSAKSNFPQTPSSSIEPIDLYALKCQELKFQLDDPKIDSMDKVLKEMFGEDSLIKVGEASYSEVYSDKAMNRVAKVIPVVEQEPDHDYPYMFFDNLTHEFWVSELIPHRLHCDSFHSGFLQVYSASLCKGPYSSRLLNAWNSYEKSKGTENPSPTLYEKNQIYGLLIMEHGGDDLEKFCMTDSNQLWSVFVQIGCFLALTEILFEFEHRDLHWGNILVKKTDETFIDLPVIEDGEYRIRRIPSFGVKCFIIDLTLCRLLIDDRVYYTNLDDDPSLFEADDSQDYQFTVYKEMKSCTAQWSMFQPKNNILWCNYLLDKLCNKKRIKNGDNNKNVKRELRALKERILKYDSVYEMLQDDVFFRCDDKEIN